MSTGMEFYIGSMDKHVRDFSLAAQNELVYWANMIAEQLSPQFDGADIRSINPLMDTNHAEGFRVMDWKGTLNSQKEIRTTVIRILPFYDSESREEILGLFAGENQRPIGYRS